MKFRVDQMGLVSVITGQTFGLIPPSQHLFILLIYVTDVGPGSIYKGDLA